MISKITVAESITNITKIFKPLSPLKVAFQWALLYNKARYYPDKLEFVGIF